jgi:hypothetical protein
VKLASINTSRADQNNTINPHVPKGPNPSMNYSILAKKEAEGVNFICSIVAFFALL